MTAPIVRKPRLLTEDLSLSELTQRFLDENSLVSKLDLTRATAPFQFELFRPEAMPGFGRCGVLRNNSAFGCSYLHDSGRETKLGVDFKTYPGGLGLSLKFFLGGR